MNREQEKVLTQYLVDLVVCRSLREVERLVEAASHDGDIDNRSFRVLAHVSDAVSARLRLSL